MRPRLLLALLAVAALAALGAGAGGAGASSGRASAGAARQASVISYTGPAVVAAANRLRRLAGEPPLHAAPYDELGGSADWIVEPDGATSTELDTIAAWPELLAVLLDPRTTRQAWSLQDDGAVALALDTDTAQPLAQPVYPLRLDPAAPGDPVVLLPRRPVTVRLFETRGAAEVPIPTAVTRARGAAGAWLAQISVPASDDGGLHLAYATRYRLVVDGVSRDYVTPPLPARYVRRSWRYGPALRPADRAAFLAAIASAPPYARTLIGLADGGLLVDRKSCDDEYTSCAGFDEKGAYYLHIAPADFADTVDDLRFVTLHELGHVIDYLGLDARAYADFRALFVTSPRWKACFPDDTSDSGCVEFAEIFADQFAYWATGLPADPSGGYGDPPLAAPADFERVLRANWAFRPPLYRNPAVR